MSKLYLSGNKSHELYLSGIQEFINHIKGLHASPDKNDESGEEAKGFNTAVEMSVSRSEDFITRTKMDFVSMTPAPINSNKHTPGNINSFLDGMNAALSIVKKKINNGQITIKH